METNSIDLWNKVSQNKNQNISESKLCVDDPFSTQSCFTFAQGLGPKKIRKRTWPRNKCTFCRKTTSLSLSLSLQLKSAVFIINLFHFQNSLKNEYIYIYLHKCCFWEYTYLMRRVSDNPLYSVVLHYIRNTALLCHCLDEYNSNLLQRSGGGERF